MRLALSVLLVVLSVTNALAETKIKFSNGNEIIFKDDDQGKNIVFKNNLASGEETSLTREVAEVPPVNEPAKIAVFFTPKGIWFVNETGTYQKLSPETARLALKGQPPVIDFSSHYFHTADHTYLLLSLKYGQPVDDMTGETYIIRDDGKSELIDLRAYPLDSQLVTLHDGVLRLTRQGPNVNLDSLSVVTPREIYPFANGNRLVVRTYGSSQLTYFLPKAGRAVALSRDKVLYGPRLDGNVLPPIAIFETDKGVHLVTSEGKTRVVGADYTKVKRAGDNSYLYTRHDFQHGGKTYAVLSFQYEGGSKSHSMSHSITVGGGSESSSKSVGEGETWIVREDGVAFRLEYKAKEKLDRAVSIDNGILTLKGFVRQVDLDHLGGEARFRVGNSKKNSDGSGSDVSDPVGDTDKKFVDALAEIRANPDTVFPAMDPQTIQDMRIALGKREAGSIALVGESGTGKTQMIRSFIAGIARGEYPEVPRTTRVYTVDGMGMTAGTKYVGTFEAKLNTLVEACRRVPCLLFIDEIHSLIGAGTSEGNPNGIFQFLKTALSDGSIRILSTTTEEEFFNAFAGDPALMRRFTLVTKKAPEGEGINKALRAWSTTNGKPVPEKAVLDYAIELSGKYNALGAQPAKTTALLDYAHSMMELTGTFDATLTQANIREAAQRLYQLDEAFFIPAKLKAKIDGLEAGLEQYVIGQRSLKAALVQLTRQFYAGVHEETKPAIRILVAGPPGTGKTESARAYAEYMGLPFKRIEMTRYAQGDPAKFLAEIAEALRKNPFSVLAFDELEKASPQVQQALLGLLDSGVFTVSERLNSTSRGGDRTVRVNARNATIIATTNAGGEYVLNPKGGEVGPNDRPRMGFGAIQEDRAQNELDLAGGPEKNSLASQTALVNAVVKDGIPKTVVDRFQVTVSATAPKRHEFIGVMQLHLRRAIKEQSARQKVKISLTNEEPFLEAMAAKFFSEGMSNRIALDIVQNYFRTALADALLSGSVGPNGELELHFDAGSATLVPSCAQRLGE